MFCLFLLNFKFLTFFCDRHTNKLKRPRASSVAERLWSDASVNNITEARTRFHEMHCRLQRQGLRPGPIDGPGYCQCDYAL